MVLVGLLPPLLYSAALSTSLVDFNANRRVILLLSVGLVVFTTCGVAVVAHWLVPDLPWAASFAIGAVVAPPDAVAATAIGRRIGLPRRIVTILEGESLLNDATALVALRTATAVTVTVTAGSLSLDFVLAAGGGTVVGLAVFLVVAKVRKRLTDPLLDSGLSFITPFGAYVAAEELHIPGLGGGSGVIAVVVAGLLLGHKAPILQTAQSRIQERMNWSTIAILLRLAWVSLVRFVLVRPGTGTRQRPPWAYVTVLGWAGMRGVVTLAAAFVIPTDTPNRDLLLLVAFTVTAGTLFLQGLSLPWLARRLKLPSPDPAADALVRANLLHHASQAAMAELDELDEGDPYGVRDQIKDRLERRNFSAWEAIGAKDEETPSEAYSRIRGQMIDTERKHVLEVRSTGTVPHEVVTQVLSMLDVEESMLEYSSRERDQVRASLSTSPGGGCEHLQEVRSPVEPNMPGECAECIREGLAWVHLRMCVSCGNVGCCDSSIGRHATAHFHATEHPVMRSAEPGDDWRWCFVDELTG